MGLQNYLDLDLSEAAKRLNARLENEVSRHDAIGLSDLVGSQPSFLTPQMETWYQGTIATVRHPAIAELARQFREKQADGQEEGFLPERELARIDDEYIRSRRNCYRSIAEKYSAQIIEIQALTKSIIERGNEFRARRAELGRDPTMLNRPLYILGLLAIVLTESFINFASFSSLSWATPFIATGSTLIVAALVTLAAHLHGSAIKQADYFFGAHAPDAVRYAGWRHVAVGTVALLVALLFVYYARSAYLAIYVASLGAFGMSSQGHSPLWIIGGSLLGNIAVYLAGVGLAYLLHDHDPNFPKLKEDVNADEKMKKKLLSIVEGERTRRLRQLEEQWKKRVAEIKRASAGFLDAPFFVAPRTALSALQAKDASVVEILENYRTSLLDRARANGGALKFSAAQDDPDKRGEWSDSLYERQALKLKYLED